MTEPDRLPLRVLVKGPSTPVDASAMEARLHEAGYPAEVRSRAAEPTRLALRSWQADVLAWSPDVVVLGYGEVECARLLPPRRRRVAADLGRLIEVVRTVASPLVLILEIPGRTARAAAMNATLGAVVAGVDHPDVRCIEVGELADVILGWAAGQTHLDLDDVRARRTD